VIAQQQQEASGGGGGVVDRADRLRRGLGKRADPQVKHTIPLSDPPASIPPVPSGFVL
jgi:hypothetical protein